MGSVPPRSIQNTALLANDRWRFCQLTHLLRRRMLLLLRRRMLLLLRRRMLLLLRRHLREPLLPLRLRRRRRHALHARHEAVAHLAVEQLREALHGAAVERRRDLRHTRARTHTQYANAGETRGGESWEERGTYGS
eukprot:TRINITY_DN2563_c0_g1_i2.p1 TRINITY_DN2563_c0_g1~~TRINITY_DN2563_c0_g1_i2.p1  ORF type:complete len:136 (+),score=31.50 TRINITY_DN2563_c0_g1_i2:463-870(+)